MLQISVTRLHDETREKLGLAWLAGRPGGEEFVRRDTANGAALVGHLNLIHPNCIQVIGSQNSITENRVVDNDGTGIDVSGDDNVLEKNKVGEDDGGNRCPRR